jgi:hypothetical protein
MIYLAINAVVVIAIALIEILLLDGYIRRLVDAAVARQCGNCEFKKSKIPEQN